MTNMTKYGQIVADEYTSHPPTLIENMAAINVWPFHFKLALFTAFGQ